MCQQDCHKALLRLLHPDVLTCTVSVLPHFRLLQMSMILLRQWKLSRFVRFFLNTINALPQFKPTCSRQTLKALQLISDVSLSIQFLAHVLFGPASYISLAVSLSWSFAPSDSAPQPSLMITVRTKSVIYLLRWTKFSGFESRHRTTTTSPDTIES